MANIGVVYRGLAVALMTSDLCFYGVLA